MYILPSRLALCMYLYGDVYLILSWFYAEKCISLESQLFCFNENTCDNKPIGVLLSEMLPNQQTIGSVEVLGATATGELVSIHVHCTHTVSIKINLP